MVHYNVLVRYGSEERRTLSEHATEEEGNEAYAQAYAGVGSSLEAGQSATICLQKVETTVLRHSFPISKAVDGVTAV